MNARKWRLVLIFGIVMLSSVSGRGDSVKAKHQSPIVIAEQGSGVMTDGAYVVWNTYPGGDIANGDVYGSRLDGGEAFPIATGPANQLIGGIDNGIVVWMEEDLDEPCNDCSFDIRGMNLSTGEVLAIVTTPVSESRPSISGNLVVWEQWDEHGLAIQVRDISAMTEPTTVATPYGPGADAPRVSGDRVVWEEVVDGSFSIYSKRIGDEDAVLVGSGSPAGAGASYGFDVAGDTIIFIDTLWNMVISNAVNGEARSFSISPYDQQPTFDGRYIVWQDHRDDNVWGLRGYDLLTDSDFLVVAGDQRTFHPDLQEGTLVWVSGDTNGEVMAATFDDLLPSAPVDDPAFTDGNGVWFPETGHTLSWGFKGFWERSGGLPVFGYSLTEEYAELNRDTRQYHTVQYLERQRFEWHPEFAGGPYEVLLGRLGYENASERKLLETAPFLPVPTGPPSDGCEFFMETEHRVCDAFLHYWRTHGLDLGDAGVSYRESLDLFGYPLSEPYTDPESGLTIQYFERAIFELHPENDEPYQVLLRRLGAEVLTEQGWLGVNER